MAPHMNSLHETRNSRKARRRGTRHVKSGCRTCKIRRIKCDEKRPSCERCTSTGRTCDGYGIWSNAATSDKTPSFSICGTSDFSPISINGKRAAIQAYCCGLFVGNSVKDFKYTSMKAEPDELTCLEFFQLRSLAKLPGFFESDFWERVLPQLSCTESAVFHAVVALASTQRSQEFTSCMQSRTGVPSIDDDADYQVEKWNRFALQQYNKAITSLQSHFKENSYNSVQVALTTCILFICIEFMRGSYSTANVHIDHGINVMKDLQWRMSSIRTVKNTNLSKPIIRKSEPRTVDDHLLEILARMNTQCVLFGYPQRYIYGTEREYYPMHKVPDMFLSLQESRQFLEVILGKTVRLVGKAKNNKLKSTLVDTRVGTDPLDTRQELLDALESWMRTYEKIEDKILPTLEIRPFIGLTVLRIHSIMIKIMLQTCPGPTETWKEMAFDNYTQDFRNLMRTARDLLMTARFPGHDGMSHLPCLLGPLNFSADMGTIAPLYYTALKCRVPHLRRQAIRFLSFAPHREAVWDGAAVAGAAEKVVQLEEGGLYKLNNCEFSSSLSSPASKSPSFTRQEPLPESCRFQDIQILMEDGLKCRGRVVCTRRIHDNAVATESKLETIEKWFECDERVNTFSWNHMRDMYRDSELDRFLEI